MKKRLKELRRALEDEGYLWESTRGGHVKVTRPGHKGMVFMGATPSDHRSLENTLGDLRREFGFVAPWKRPASSSAR